MTDTVTVDFKKSRRDQRPVLDSEQLSNIAVSALFARSEDPFNHPILVPYKGEWWKTSERTKYTEDAPKRLIEMMARGASVVQVATALGVYTNTLKDWATEGSMNCIPEMVQALKLGHQLAQSWWESQAHIGIHSRDFNANTYKFMMANRFPDHYSESPVIQQNTIIMDNPLLAAITQAIKTDMSKPSELMLELFPTTPRPSDSLQSEVTVDV